MLTTGYHTLQDLDNVDKIEGDGPIKCETKAAWLGFGYYFWDANIDWAHKFGRSRYQSDYMVFEAEILLNNETFDLFGNVSHKLEFREVWKLLKEKGAPDMKSDIRVADVLEYIKRYLKFPYNSVRAADNPDRQNVIQFGGLHGEFMFLNERVQICLITKKNLSLPSFRVVYPEKYVQQ
jgi:hypothetical protein